MAALTTRERKLQRWNALKSERSSWITRYQNISDYLLVFSGRYFVQDRNRGDRTFNKIYDSTGTRALRILAAGMMAGMTSPARPWFRLATTDPAVMELEPVKLWLADVSELMRQIFARSNTYRTLHTLYEELGAFGTGVTIVEDDFDAVIWHYAQTVGQYCIATDSKGKVNTLYREFEMTVASMVEMFGLENCSLEVQNLYTEAKNLDAWRPVLHAIEPRAYSERDPKKRDPKNMRFSSCWIEVGSNEEKYLRESGYNDFPVLAARWHTAGGDIYGDSPGMEALGDIKQLQHEQYRKAQGIDYMTQPPLQVTGQVKGRENASLPGGVTAIDSASPSGGMRSAFDVQLNLQHLLADIVDVRGRINQAFYADLFLMISNMEGVQPRNRFEIAERHEEKLLMLGPVLERLHDELLDPLIDITFAKMVRSGILPQAPRELEGMDLKVEFVSTLAQAQRAVGLGSLDRLLATVVSIAPVKPDVLDKLDTDQIVDKYADMLGVDPSTIVADEKIVILRDERAKRQFAAQQAAMVQPAAAAVRDLAAAPTDGKNALTDVMQNFTGYTTAQAA